MTCQRCQSQRIIGVEAECTDMCVVKWNRQELDGYVLKDTPFGHNGDSPAYYGDFIQFELCMECGQMQGKFPALDIDLSETGDL